MDVMNTSSASTAGATNNTTNHNNSQNVTSNEDFLNQKINFIQNHIENLLHEITNLPVPWTYGVDIDGRIFFINDEKRITSWLHPLTHKPVSVMLIPPLEDLPIGWEKDHIYGVPYFINHNNRTTSFILPESTSIKTQISTSPPKLLNSNYSTLNKNNDNHSTSTTATTTVTFSNKQDVINNYTNEQQIKHQQQEKQQQQQQIVQQQETKQRIRKSGWIYKLNQTGFKLWKKRYFVLNDSILNYYSDASLNKQCGTLYMNETQTKLCTKKDGSASNKKNSFKIDWLINQKRNTFFLACDTQSETNEWINLLNLASSINKNEINFINSTTNISAPKSIIKQQKTTIGPVEMTTPLAYKQDKANSAPNSPTYGRNKRFQTLNMNSTINNDNKSLNESKNYYKPQSITTLNNLSSQNRSTSLTKIKFNNQNYISQPNLTENNKENYQSIYDAFEKPIIDTQNSYHSQQQHQQQQQYNTRYINNDQNPILKAVNNINENLNSYKHYKSDQNLPNSILQQKQQQQPQLYSQQLGKSQIIYQTNLDNYEMQFISNDSPKSPQKQIKIGINNFYHLNKQQIEGLMPNELKMLIKQLRRNYTLLNHSNQRFNLLLELYKPYEVYYQEQLQLNNSNSNNSRVLNTSNDLSSNYSTTLNLNTYYSYLHDSYQTIKDRIKKIYLKMDIIGSCTDAANSYENFSNNNNSTNTNLNDNSISLQQSSHFDLIKLFEYQIIEMQHEYELLLEDKLIVEKLIDNQLRIFAQHTNLSNEKTLIQQFNALNHELELLKIQLNKVNQLLNDTIAEKCKQEINYQAIEQQQQQQTQQVPSRQQNNYQQRTQQQQQEPILNPNLNPMQQYKIKNYFDSHTNVNDQKIETNLFNNSSIWKQPIATQKPQQQYFTSLVDTNKNFDQVESAIKSQSNNYFSNNYRANLNNSTTTTSSTRDMIREKRRASIGRVPYNHNNQTIQNDNKPSAMERLFGSQKNLDQLNAIKKVAMVRPEMRNDENDIVRFTERNQMEYFDNYDEQIEKKLTVPETVIIPERYFENEVEDNNRLTPEEIIAKKKRLEDLKKVLAAQSLHDYTLNEINKQAELSLYNDRTQQQQQQQQLQKPITKGYLSNLSSDNDSSDLHSKYEHEKQVREKVLDIKHDLAQQVKERSRQIAENGIFVMKMAQTYDRISLKNEQYKQGLNKFYSKFSSTNIATDA